MPASSHASDFDAESPRCSDASTSVSDWPPEPRLRGLRWRVFLGVLPACPAPIETLRRAAANGRRRYAELRRRLIVDPHTMEDVHRGENLSVNNPLSQDPDSIWGHYFKNTELERSIENDITRLYPEHGSFFQGLSCQSMLKRILLVWALSHSQYGYRQGMHEVLAPIVYVLNLDFTHLSQVRQRYEDPFEDRFDTPHDDKFSSSREARPVVPSFSPRSSLRISNESTICGGNEGWIHRVHPDDLTLVEPDDFGFNLKTMLLGSDSYGAEGELGALLSGRFLEHDAYCMFDALLRGHNGAVVLADYFLAANEGGTGMSPVLEACATMYLTLAAVDTPLYVHLVEIGVEPQFFALRWFRVLFGREFDLEMLLHLWDAIFTVSHSNAVHGVENNAKTDVSCTSNGASFISNFAVSMIVHLRSTLLAAPNATVCLQKLLNFPKHVDVRSLIENAKVLQTFSEDSSKNLPSLVGKHARFFESSRGGRHRHGSPSPSFHGHMPTTSKVLQHRHSGSPEMSRHLVTETYWEERWMNSVLTKEVSEDVCADTGANRSGSDLGDVSGSEVLEGPPVSGTSVDNSQKSTLSNGISPAHSNSQPTRRNLFATFFKGAAQLLSFEDRKSDATVSSSEAKTCSAIEAPGTNKAENEETNFNGAESSVGEVDPGGRLARAEGSAEVPVSDMWTSDDGETSCSGDEGGRLHCTSDQSTDTVNDSASVHPLEAVECTRVSSDSECNEDSEHNFASREGISIPGVVRREENDGADTLQELNNHGGCTPKVTTGKHSKAVLQTLGHSMAESIQVIESALSGVTKDGAPTSYRETAESLSKALLNGKGHLTALSALAELRKISSLLLQM